MVKKITKFKFKNKIVGELVRAVSFVVIFAVILYLSSNIFTPKQNVRENGINYFNARGFYGEPADSLDILAFGNSDLYSAFSPMVLWRDHGYASYVSGEARQTVRRAYGALNEALTCQHPKLVIFETDCIYERGLTPSNIEGGIANFIQNTFPIVEFHDRWKALDKQDFTKIPLHTWKSKSKGFGISNKIDPYLGKEYMIKTKNEEPFISYNVPYLNKIVELCAEQKIPLLFVEMPSANSWNYARHNAVSAYASRHGIPFLDMNLNRDSFGFSWLTDTRDKGSHLNCSGAEKVTSFLGKYISAIYNIPSHREDAAYLEWNQALADYTKKVMI